MPQIVDKLNVGGEIVNVKNGSLGSIEQIRGRYLDQNAKEKKVNVKNNMVVTAVGDSEDKIFTNIDGAVIS